MDANVSVHVFRPASARAGTPALLWIHGGGMVLGAAAQDSRFCRRVADELNIVVVSVEYRLAPEHSFPIPLEDCYTALQWLARQPDVDPANIAIGGQSAGGGLAAALALLAKERGEIRPVLQLLSYPMLDDRTTIRTDIDPRWLRIWSPRSNRFGWRAYLGEATADANVPRWQRPPVTTTSPACRPHGSASAPTTCSMTRTSPTPGGCRRPASPLPCA
ncbi:alpha/beta hydrolase fold domain-containing protein [Arthrobacter sp. SA17]